jgi:hypothetical protein
MQFNINPYFIYISLFLWFAPVISAVWGYPVWITISFMCMFAIYTVHEFAHLWICKLNNLEVLSLNLSHGGNTEIIFEKPDSDKVAADVYLAGVAWDSIFFAIAILSCYFYAFYQGDITPLIFGTSLIFILIFNLAMPGSDWQEFRKRTALRV